MKIWTDQQNSKRQMDNMSNPKGKSCGNCQWGSTIDGDAWTTCGHHIDNFRTTSLCSYWTSRTDPKVKAAFNKRKSELKHKH